MCLRSTCGVGLEVVAWGVGSGREVMAFPAFFCVQKIAWTQFMAQGKMIFRSLNFVGPFLAKWNTYCMNEICNNTIFWENEPTGFEDLYATDSLKKISTSLSL